MITLRIVHSYEYATGEVDSHEYELEVDQPYNPTIMRDMRDCLMSMLPDAPADTAELTEYEEDSSEQ